MIDKFHDWTYGILGTIIGFMMVETIRFRRTVSEKYVHKDDFVRIMNENREDHNTMFKKLDAIRDKLDGKADK